MKNLRDGDGLWSLPKLFTVSKEKRTSNSGIRYIKGFSYPGGKPTYVCEIVSEEG